MSSYCFCCISFVIPKCCFMLVLDLSGFGYLHRSFHKMRLAMRHIMSCSLFSFQKEEEKSFKPPEIHSMHVKDYAF